jgi:hypothetical protein
VRPALLLTLSARGTHTPPSTMPLHLNYTLAHTLLIMLLSWPNI